MSDDVTGLFDVADLLDRCLQDASFAEEMLQIFATQVPQTLARLDTAFQSGNAPEAAKAAHSLKGSAGNLSARSLHGLSMQLEKTLVGGDCTSPAAVALFQQCRDTCRRTLEAVPSTLTQVKARAAA